MQEHCLGAHLATLKGVLTDESRMLFSNFASDFIVVFWPVLNADYAILLERQILVE